MKKENLIIGEIYKQGSFIFEYCDHENNKGRQIGYGNHLDIDISWFYIRKNIHNSGSTLIESATQQEKNWLNACIKAGKFIPLLEIKNTFTYEIY